MCSSCSCRRSVCSSGSLLPSLPLRCRFPFSMRRALAGCWPGAVGAACAAGAAAPGEVRGRKDGLRHRRQPPREKRHLAQPSLRWLSSIAAVGPEELGTGSGSEVGRCVPERGGA